MVMVLMTVLMMMLMMMFMTVHVAALADLVFMLVMMMFVYHMQCYFCFPLQRYAPGDATGLQKKRQQDLLLLSCIVKASPA